MKAAPTTANKAAMPKAIGSLWKAPSPPSLPSSDALGSGADEDPEEDCEEEDLLEEDEELELELEVVSVVEGTVLSDVLVVVSVVVGTELSEELVEVPAPLSELEVSPPPLVKQSSEVPA